MYPATRAEPPTSTDPQTLTCRPCINGCLTCWRDGHCSRCKPGFFQLLEEKCYDVCPDTTAADPVMGRCVIDCSPGLVTDSSSKTCLKECPIGTYLSTIGRCYKCLPGCATCFEHTCFECLEGLSLLPPESPTGYGQCVKDCPRGYFKSNTGKECKLCPPGCSQCTRANRCTMCLPGMLVQVEPTTGGEFCT